MQKFLIQVYDKDYRWLREEMSMEFPSIAEAQQWCASNMEIGVSYHVIGLMGEVKKRDQYGAYRNTIYDADIRNLEI